MTDSDKESEARNKLAQRARERELNDLRFLISQKEGRRFLRRLFEVTGVFRTSFTGNSTTFFNEGARNVGLTFLSDAMEADPKGAAETLTKKEEADG